MKKILIVSALWIAALLTSGCDTSGTDDQAEKQVPVAVSTVTLGDVTQSLHFMGDIKAEFEVNVFSKIPDRIETYYIDEGDFVKKGDPIADIAAVTVEQSVRQAEAGLAAARAQETNLASEYARAKKLFSEDAMSQQQFDAVQTQYEAVSAQVTQASAALKSAKSYFGDATVTAPISGIIGKRYLEAGDMAAPSLPVASVVQMDRVKIEIEVTERDLGKLSPGQEAAISVRSYPDETFSGRLVKISPVLDPMTRMATAEIIIPNRDHKLKPGMFAEAVVTTGVLDDVIVLPRHAVIESTTMQTVEGQDVVGKDYYVYVVADSNRAERRRLTLAYVNHNCVAVSDGVTLGERFVVRGQNNLRDGAALLISEEAEQ
ncbi:efflux RND transporter periplasmic adaptor subunit [bacterium]|nr:efflux RND transporter periplasmic adaptor subunit [bacterium]